MLEATKGDRRTLIDGDYIVSPFSRKGVTFIEKLS